MQSWVRWWLLHVCQSTVTSCLMATTTRCMGGSDCVLVFDRKQEAKEFYNTLGMRCPQFRIVKRSAPAFRRILQRHEGMCKRKRNRDGPANLTMWKAVA